MIRGCNILLTVCRSSSSFRISPKAASQFLILRSFHHFKKERRMVQELDSLPEYIEYRLKLWNQFRVEYDDFLSKQVPQDIKVKVTWKKDSAETVKEISGKSWQTTPYSIARECVSKAFADSLVISKVDGNLWDLERPLEKDCNIELLTFDEPQGKEVFWHSTAHVLGEAIERVYGGHLCYGPPIENGFYYDVYFPRKENVGEDEQTNVSTHDFPVVQGVMSKICKERQPFERLELTKEQLLQMFNYNQFKVRILNEKVTEDRTTVYRCGSLIDLCRGPHVRHTGIVESSTLTKTSSCFWEGKQDAETLIRVYGISFPNKKQLKEWQNMMAEAAKRDHRKIGREQDLFFFHELSPGSAFFSPKGAFIYNTLIEFMRKEYRKRGFQEVMSPNIFNSKLWVTSGHWDHYSEDMFKFESREKETFALKPMNCPGHCLIFDSTVRSWRDLPLRLAEFGVLHRNELSGALSGLTRVRRFQQDDAHIFCTHEQIEQEVSGALNFLKDVYHNVFGFTFDLVLSTRPEKFLGEVEQWNEAEAALSAALDKMSLQWGLNPGDGAFYGPKIDITIKDALQRPFQCATIQLDFQLPQRFQLKYSADDGSRKTPVIIHRAVFGSLERFMAILTENFAGKWPFWLSPRQAIVLPIGEGNMSYAESVKQTISAAGFQVDIEPDSGLTIQKKVRNAQVAQYNFILVVGKEEEKNNSVNVRTRDNVVHGEVSVSELIQKFTSFLESKTRSAEQDFGPSKTSEEKKKVEE